MHPRPTSSPEHAPLFRLLGRLLGISLATGVPLPIRLSRLFYKSLFSAAADAETGVLDDLRFVDAPLHALLGELLSGPLGAQGAGLTFADDVPEAGEVVLVPLLPGGLALPVTDENKASYVALKAAARVKRATDAATRAALRQGLSDFVPPELLDPALFDAAELQELLEGAA